MPKVFPFPLYRSSQAITSISSYSRNISKKRKIRHNYSKNNNIRMAVAATRRNLFQTNCWYSRKSSNLKLVSKISSNLHPVNKSLRQIMMSIIVLLLLAMMLMMLMLSKSNTKTTTVIRRRRKRSSTASPPGISSLNNKNNERSSSSSSSSSSNSSLCSSRRRIMRRITVRNRNIQKTHPILAK